MEKPTFKQKVDGFCKFVWNSETSEFLGRGGKSWLEIGVFYLIYYCCLAAFFSATILVFYETIDENSPKLMDDSSLLKGNPGMGYKPMPDIDTTLIHVHQDKVKKNKDSIVDVLKDYTNEGAPLENTVECTPGEADSDGRACRVDYKALTQECNEANDFGYKDGKPCVLLKLNRIFGWNPDLWEAGDENIPKDIASNYNDTMIMISCTGENPADKDNIGEIKYYPQQGFPLEYYPYKKQENYRSPLVFVQFTNPKSHIGLMIECKAYAKNIRIDQMEKQGSVHFELLKDMI